MVDAKTLIIRDIGTEIKAIAIRPHGERVFRMAGYAIEDQPHYVLLGMLTGNGSLTSDCFAWGNRTMWVAHRVLQDMWDQFNDDGELDVRNFPEYIRVFES